MKGENNPSPPGIEPVAVEFTHICLHISNLYIHIQYIYICVCVKFHKKKKKKKLNTDGNTTWI